MFVTTTARLTHAGAKHMMATAQAAGIAVSVAIRDAGGHLIVLERIDGGRAVESIGAAT